MDFRNFKIKFLKSKSIDRARRVFDLFRESREKKVNPRQKLFNATRVFHFRSVECDRGPKNGHHLNPRGSKESLRPLRVEVSIHFSSTAKMDNHLDPRGSGQLPDPCGSRFSVRKAANFSRGGSDRSRFARGLSRSGVARNLFSRRISTIWSFYSRFDWGFDGWVGLSRRRGGSNSRVSATSLAKIANFQKIENSHDTLTALKILH